MRIKTALVPAHAEYHQETWLVTLTCGQSLFFSYLFPFILFHRGKLIPGEHGGAYFPEIIPCVQCFVENLPWVSSVYTMAGVLVFTVRAFGEAHSGYSASCS